MRPAAQITLDGLDITANLIPAPWGIPLAGGGAVLALGNLAVAAIGGVFQSAPLISLTVTDNEGKKSDSADFVLADGTFQRAPKKGQTFEIWLGYVETGLVHMGTFQVDQWSKQGRPRTMQVSAKAVGFDTEIKSPKSRSYHDKTVGDIFEQIAGKNSLSSKIHPELKGIKIGHIDQSSESDLHFMTRLAERVGGNFKLANGFVILNKAGSGTLPSGSPAPVFPISEVGLLSWSATGSERGSYGSASAYYQDPKKGERVNVKTGEKKPRYRDRRLFKTEEEANTAIEARLSSLNRGKVSFTCSMPGQPEIFAGARFAVGLGDLDIDGLFGIKTATHALAGRGFVSSFSCESGEDRSDEGE